MSNNSNAVTVPEGDALPPRSAYRHHERLAAVATAETVTNEEEKLAAMKRRNSLEYAVIAKHEYAEERLLKVFNVSCADLLEYGRGDLLEKTV